MVKFTFSSVFLILAAGAALVFALPSPNENTSSVKAASAKGAIQSDSTGLFFLSSVTSAGPGIISQEDGDNNLVFDPPLGHGKTSTIKGRNGTYINPGPATNPFIIWGKTAYKWTVDVGPYATQFSTVVGNLTIYWYQDGNTAPWTQLVADTGNNTQQIGFKFHFEQT
ncbi:hypothetical protein AX14_009997 [Amanita brunnescens Koide BX004]|nr:hypothetical protein AX14_009997 [Amanita brunnescens Koide BX004]